MEKYQDDISLCYECGEGLARATQLILEAEERNRAGLARSNYFHLAQCPHSARPTTASLSKTLYWGMWTVRCVSIYGVCGMFGWPQFEVSQSWAASIFVGSLVNKLPPAFSVFSQFCHGRKMERGGSRRRINGSVLSAALLDNCHTNMHLYTSCLVW